ncbi:unnamed protein product [Coregonus sp. 'balchen']|nr:unnamed protein product [Coregonus sp. 'balchen']
MSMSTFQMVTLVSCMVLCVALLIPKMLLGGGKKGAQTESSGRFPPMVHRQMAPDSQGQRAAGSTRAHNTEAIARAKGGTGGKSNLAGQIIPIYGFGILLYILYLLFKITSKVKSAVPAEPRLPSVRGENRKKNITDFELTQLQDKLRETEMVMERIVSKASYSSKRFVGDGVSADQEERLLLRLREITRVMQEGRLVEGVAPPEMGAQHWEAQTTDEGGADQKEGGADQKEGVVDHEVGAAEDDEGGAEAGANLNTDEEGAADLATGNEEGGAKCDVGGTEVEKEGMDREKGGANDKLGVADEMGGAEEQGEELEFTLKMSIVLE